MGPNILMTHPFGPPVKPTDGGDGDGVPTTLPIWQDPWGTVCRNQMSRAGNPSLRQIGPPKGIEARNSEFLTKKLEFCILLLGHLSRVVR